jgi:hypothetical protein
MQRDTHIKLGEVHNSLDALRRSIEDILDTALVEVPKEEPFKLRFITPSIPVEDWLEDERCADYELTSPAAHEPDMAYITVSYCWQHEQSIEGLPPMPNYRLRDWSKSEGASRLIRCPSLVFHRAMMYARQQHCPRVWIDQECIDQDNSVDVEKHLQIMHLVYDKSRWTVAILSRTLQHVVASFPRISHHTKFEQTETPRVEPIFRFRHSEQDSALESEQKFSGLVEFIRFLQEIAKDRWFTRTWVVQERYCAQRLHLLLPLEPTLVARERDHLSMLGFDICLDLQHVQNCFKLNNSEHPRKRLDMCTNVQEAFFCEEMRQLAARYTTAKNCALPKDRNPPRINSKRLFRETEICDNLLVADRVSILGAICGLPLRLLSNRLHDENYSYSTCVLALFLANRFPSRAQRMKFLDHYGTSLLRFRIGIILRLHFEYSQGICRAT